MSNFKLLNISQLWKYTKGEGIKIAILDTGIDYTHDNLRDCVKGGINFTNKNSNNYIDRYGHGTFCAGIIGSKSTDGVAPNSEIYSVKVVNDAGIGSEEWIKQGLMWCLQNGINIVSMSLAYQQYNESIYAIIKKMNKYGIIVIAANNNGDIPDYPAVHPEVISCSNIYRNIRDIIVPGNNILSTYLYNSFNKNSGSSFSCAYVTGIVALLQSKNLLINRKLLKKDDIYKILKEQYSV